MGITACRSRWETRVDINDSPKLWRAFKALSTSTCSPFIGTWWSDCCSMPPKSTTDVCVVGRIAEVGLAVSLRVASLWRNVLCGVGHTIGCMLPDEGHNEQLCDWWPGYETREGYAEFAGGAAVNISAQKDDAGRQKFERAAPKDATLLRLRKELQHLPGWRQQ